MKNAFGIKFVLVILFAAVTCAASDDKKADDKKRDDTAGAAAPGKAMTIPKDAVPHPDGSYSYTDKQGKKWNYVKTAFGITRFPASDQPAAVVPPDTSRIKVIDKGDTVRFEHPGPMGPLGYEKKKSELTDDERRILDSSKADSSKADSSKARTQQNEKTQ